MQQNKSDYDDDEEMTPDELMELVNDKFKNLKTSNKWNARIMPRPQIMRGVPYPTKKGIRG
jgi:hypothetical protein